MSGTEFLSTSDLSKLIGIATITLQQWRARGGGPVFIRMGRSVRYPRVDVDRWIAANTVGKVG